MIAPNSAQGVSYPLCAVRASELRQTGQNDRSPWLYPLTIQAVDTPANASHTKLVLYSMGRKKRRRLRGTGIASARTLADLPTGERCILDRLDLPEDIARRLMELGFLPGNEVVTARRAPGGGPRVFRVDGSEVALRDETASKLYVRQDSESDPVVLA